MGGEFIHNFRSSCAYKQGNEQKAEASKIRAKVIMQMFVFRASSVVRLCDLLTSVTSVTSSP